MLFEPSVSFDLDGNRGVKNPVDEITRCSNPYDQLGESGFHLYPCFGCRQTAVYSQVSSSRVEYSHNGLGSSQYGPIKEEKDHEDNVGSAECRILYLTKHCLGLVAGSFKILRPGFSGPAQPGSQRDQGRSDSCIM